MAKCKSKFHFNFSFTFYHRPFNREDKVDLQSNVFTRCSRLTAILFGKFRSNYYCKTFPHNHGPENNAFSLIGLLNFANAQNA